MEGGSSGQVELIVKEGKKEEVKQSFPYFEEREDWEQKISERSEIFLPSSELTTRITLPTPATNICCFFSSVVTCTKETKIALLNETGFVLREFEGPKSVANSFGIGADLNNHFLFIGYNDGKIRQWILQTGILLQTFNLERGSVTSVAATPKEVFGSLGNSIFHFNVVTGELIRKYSGHTALIQCLRYINSKYLFSGSLDGTIKQWDTTTGELVMTYKGHSRAVSCCDFSDDRKYLFSSSQDGSVIQWDIKDGSIVRKYSGTSPVHAIIVSENSVFIGTEDKVINQWNISTGNFVRAFFGHSQLISSLSFLDGDSFLSSSSDSSIIKWNIKDVRKEAVTTEPRKVRKITDNYFLIVDKTSVRIWSQFHTPLEIQSGGIHDAFLSPDRKSIFIAKGQKVQVFDIQSRKIVHEFRAHDDTIKHIVCDQHGNLFTSAANESNIKVWKAQTGKFIQSLDKHNADIFLLFVSQNNDMLISVGLDRVIHTWGINQKKDGIFHLKSTDMGNSSFVAACIVPNQDSLIIAFSDSKITQYNINKEGQAEEVKSFESKHKRTISSMTASSDGRYLYSYAHAMPDKTLKITSIETGNVVRSIPSRDFYTHMFPLAQGELFAATMDSLCLVDPCTFMGLDFFYFTNQDKITPMLDFLKKAEKDFEKEYLEEDSFGRNIGIFCARYGSINFLVDLLEKMNGKIRIDTPNKTKTSSVLFAALQKKRWLLLDTIVTKYGKAKTLDSGTRSLIKEQLSQEIRNFDFVKKFLQYVELSAEDAGDLFVDIGYSSPQLIETFLLCGQNSNVQNSEGKTMLHCAVLYGDVEGSKILLDLPDIQVNHFDVNHSTPLMFAFAPRGGIIPQYILPEMKLDLEFKLDSNRLDCVKSIITRPEVSKKANLLIKDGKLRRSSYDHVLALHGQSMKDLKKERHEIKNKDEISRIRHIYKSSSDILDIMNSKPEVSSMRKKYATTMFTALSVPYAIFLLLLTVVVFVRSNDNSSHSYLFTDNLRNTLLQQDPSFTDISSSDQFWEWLEGPFINGFYPQQWYNGDSFSQLQIGFISQFNRLVGSVKVMQLRASNDSCSIEQTSLSDSIPFCFSDSLKEDKQTYGTSPGFEWKDESNVGSFDGKFGERYPLRGFSVLLTLDVNQTTTTISTLKQNKWIDEKTRVVFIQSTVYNGNINRFAVMTFVVEFLPSTGSPQSYYRIDNLTVPQSRSARDIVIIIVEIIVCIYILSEFLLREIMEIIHFLKVKKFIKSYVSKMWNYFEWTIILIFLAILATRITAIVYQGRVQYYGAELYETSTLYRQERSLVAVFIIFVYFRALKLLQIPPLIGPTVLSIIDTLKSTGFIVFVGLFIMILFFFSLAFSIVFGTDVFEFRTIGESLLSLIRLIFGDFDYQSLADSDKSLGPLFFILFFFFVGVIVMNLWIAILSDLYMEIRQKNQSIWERFITKLLIKKQKSEVLEKRIWDFFKRKIKSTRKNKILFEAEGEVLVSMSSQDLDEMVEDVRNQRSKDEEIDAQTKQVIEKVEFLSSKLDSTIASYEEKLKSVNMKINTIERKLDYSEVRMDEMLKLMQTIASRLPKEIS